MGLFSQAVPSSTFPHSFFFPGAHLSVSNPRKMSFWLWCCAVHFPQLYPCLRPSSRREEREKQQWGFTTSSWDRAILIRYNGSPPSEFWTPVDPHCWCCLCGCCYFRISWSAREQRKGKKENPGRFPPLSVSIKRSFSSPSRQNKRASPGALFIHALVPTCRFWAALHLSQG